MKLRTVAALGLFTLGTLSIASDEGSAVERFASGTPLWVLGFAAVIALVFILIPASIVLTNLGAKPAVSAQGEPIEVYNIPGWSLRSISADAMIVFCDETGWLGHSVGKYVKDKGDFGLDDHIRGASPFAPGEARAFAVKRLPVDYLVVANIYDERKITSTEKLSEGFESAIDAGAKQGCSSFVVFDPAGSWNYFTERASDDVVARMLIHAIRNSADKVSNVKVIVSSAKSLEAYKKAIS